MTGADEERLAVFHQVRDAIVQRMAVALAR